MAPLKHQDSFSPNNMAMAMFMATHSHMGNGHAAVPPLADALQTSALVIEYGGDEDQACAALLLEAFTKDRNEVASVIEQRLNARVTQLLIECSDEFVDREDQQETWRTRKLLHLKHLKSASSDALLISAAAALQAARRLIQSLRTEGTPVLAQSDRQLDDALWLINHQSRFYIAAQSPMAQELYLAALQMNSLAANNIPTVDRMAA